MAKRKATGSAARLIYASGERDADIYYATGLATTDAYPYLKQGRRKVMFASALELSRARKDAKCAVEALAQPRTDAEKKVGAISLMLRKRKIRSVTVPYDFPSGLAQKLQANGIKVHAVGSPQFFPQRAIKSGREIRFIARSQETAQQAVEQVVGLVAKARADGKGGLVLGGKPLTSEFLHEKAAMFLSARGFDAGETIICSGADSSMPHFRGSGRLYDNSQIVIDIFPKDKATRYFGDVTRTVFKGEPTGKFVRMYEAVRKVQQECLDRLHVGVTGAELYKHAADRFEKLGYRNTAGKGGFFGFNHNLGHGLGLDVHEEPRLSPTGGKLDAGNVVTIEPGLYYPKIGGIRIEDAVVVTKKGHRNLTRLPKELQIL